MKHAYPIPPHPTGRRKLVWSRRELMEATGLCYRSLANLEKRGLLRRVQAGVNVALYTHESVLILFGENGNPPSALATDSPPTEPQAG